MRKKQCILLFAAVLIFGFLMVPGCAGIEIPNAYDISVYNYASSYTELRIQGIAVRDTQGNEFVVNDREVIWDGTKCIYRYYLPSECNVSEVYVNIQLTRTWCAHERVDRFSAEINPLSKPHTLTVSNINRTAAADRAWVSVDNPIYVFPSTKKSGIYGKYVFC